MSTTHTILLVQPSKKPEGRTYSDYESVNDCMEGVCRIYEEHLKKSNPSSSQITYDISQVNLCARSLHESLLEYRACGFRGTRAPENNHFFKSCLTSLTNSKTWHVLSTRETRNLINRLTESGSKKKSIHFWKSKRLVNKLPQDESRQQFACTASVYARPRWSASYHTWLDYHCVSFRSIFVWLYSVTTNFSWWNKN